MKFRSLPRVLGYDVPDHVLAQRFRRPRSGPRRREGVGFEEISPSHGSHAARESHIQSGGSPCSLISSGYFRLRTRRNKRPCNKPAPAVQASTATFTKGGIGTVRILFALPTVALT